jgi:polyisoprenoid-binding protein YceI/rhodanese-related sulfurtransferase
MPLLKTINRTQLKQWMDEARSFVLIDVLPEEFYAAVHLPGAKNACVYNVDFVTEAERIAPDKNKPVVVYCNAVTSKAAETAGQKLINAGFTDVQHYAGGTVDWRRAGNSVEGGNPDRIADPQPASKTYQLIPDQSHLAWTGRGIGGSHTGTIKITAGSFQIMRGSPFKASFSVDMNSIANLDIKDPAWNEILIAHLKSDDFFDVEKFPAAQLEVTAFKPVEGAKTGAANYRLAAKLTIKGITKEIEFPATVYLRDDGAISAEAHFDIDRTEWNILYGSGRFFEKLGRHLVHDLISLQISFVAD